MTYDFKNQDWQIIKLPGGGVSQNDARLAVLMDIRDELRQINSKLGCYRVTNGLDALSLLGTKLRRENRKRKKNGNNRRTRRKSRKR